MSSGGDVTSKSFMGFTLAVCGAPPKELVTFSGEAANMIGYETHAITQKNTRISRRDAKSQLCVRQNSTKWTDPDAFALPIGTYAKT